jgi:hypothetical protein
LFYGLATMTIAWNFERRRDTTARFVIGVWVVAQGLAGRDTSLNAVRNRMRLSPEEALFAARRLHDEELITFVEGGAVRSNARGIERAATLMSAVRAKLQRFDEVAAALRAKGTALDVIAAVIRADGGTLACGSPDGGVPYQLALAGDVVTLQRQRADGGFEPVPDDA